MKHKLLATALAVFLTSFSTTADCGCLSGDCASPTIVPSPPAKPACHHTAANDHSDRRSGCCGKCQIEKTAVLDTLSAHLITLQTKKIATSDVQIFGPPETPIQADHSTGFFLRPFTSFFIENILGASLAFRAPPQ